MTRQINDTKDEFPLSAKRQASLARAARRQAAAARINHLGVRVSRKTVESQRYLHDIGLPHSARVAAVAIPHRPQRTAL